MNQIANIQKYPLKSVFTLSIPIFLVLILQSFYSFIDAYWISGLGPDAIIAIGYVLNLWYCIQDLGDGIGRSCNIIMSTSFGANDYENTNNVACHGLLIIILLAIIFPFLFTIASHEACILLNLEQYSTLIWEYLAIPSVLIIFVLLTNFFSAILGSEGATKKAAIICIAGNIVNIILDPILIYHFNLGMYGAGIATLAGCAVSTILFYYIFFIKGNVVIKFGREHFKYDKAIIKQIIKL